MAIPSPSVVQKRMAAWVELVDLGVTMLLARHRQQHPGADPRDAVRAALRRQAEESSRANLRIAEGLARYGR